MIEKHVRNIGFFMCSDGRHTDVRTVIIDKFFFLVTALGVINLSLVVKKNQKQLTFIGLDWKVETNISFLC